MNSESFGYTFILMPLVMFGGLSVMLAFVFLLPGVGNFLAAVWSLLTLDWLYRFRKGESPMNEKSG